MSVVEISGTKHNMSADEHRIIDREAAKLGWLADLELSCNKRDDLVVTATGGSALPGGKPRTLTIRWTSNGMEGADGKLLPTVDNIDR